MGTWEELRFSCLREYDSAQCSDVRRSQLLPQKRPQRRYPFDSVLHNAAISAPLISQGQLVFQELTFLSCPQRKLTTVREGQLSPPGIAISLSHGH